MQLTSALMVIKRGANGRFTVLLVCARQHVSLWITSRSMSHRRYARRCRDVPVCPAGRRRRRVRGLCRALRPPTVLRMAEGAWREGRRTRTSRRSRRSGNGWRRIGGAGENVPGVSVMGRAKCGWPRTGQRSPGSRRPTAPLSHGDKPARVQPSRAGTPGDRWLAPPGPAVRWPGSGRTRSRWPQRPLPSGGGSAT
jgi:hypothetical protein